MRLRYFVLILASLACSDACFGDIATNIAESDDPELAKQIAELEAQAAENQEVVDELKAQGLSPDDIRELGEEMDAEYDGLDGDEDEDEYEANPTCEAIKCNFEAETMCRWVSFGPLAAFDRSKPEDDDGSGSKSGSKESSEEKKSSFSSLDDQSIPDPAPLPPLPKVFSGDPGSSFFQPFLSRKKRQMLGDMMSAPDLGNVADIANLVPASAVGGPNKVAWSSHREQLGENPFSIKEPAEGSFFAGAYLHPGELAFMESLIEEATEEITVSFMSYEAGFNLQVRFCCDTPDFCPFESVFKTDRDHFEWSEQEATCPEGTTKLMFVCDNFGKSEAACGIDDVQLSGSDCRQVFVPPSAPLIMDAAPGEEGQAGQPPATSLDKSVKDAFSTDRLRRLKKLLKLRRRRRRH